MPAQNDAPSPETTTARIFLFPFSDSPASTIAWNCSPSRAFRLSGRLKRTSAMPSEMLMITRSDMADILARQGRGGPTVGRPRGHGRLRPMHLNLSADEVLTTTRSVRKRLDFDRPVEREIVEECLEIALQAPTGSNSQGWHWIIVEDAAKKKALADIYRKNWDIYANMPGREYAAGDTRAERMPAVRDSATYLAENFEKAPLLLVPAIDGRLDNLPSFATASQWGSLLPAVWSFMLALRERGMGSAWTTIHLMNGGEEEAAKLLGIPYERVSQAGLFPIAYTKGTDFKLAVREPLSKVLHWDKW